MLWNKQGLIFCPDGQFAWNQAYASVPTIDILAEQNKIRIYYASRDLQNRTHISFIEVRADNPKEIIYIHDQPVLSPGKNGMFDDCGTMPSIIINKGHEKWLYYTGWNVRNTVSYHNSIGLAISKDNGITFKKFAEGPLLDRTYKEPYFCATPYILMENGLWRMWYLSATAWLKIDNHMEPRYHIKYAESKNGIDWIREGKIAIDFKDEDEGGIVKPSIIKEGTLYKMWYSYRKLKNYRDNKEQSYRIGYAESKDGITWLRMDERAGITISTIGWDSDMIAYPYVYDYGNKRYMLYNGNVFGKTGFGYAVLE